MERQSGLSELSVISWVSAIEGWVLFILTQLRATLVIYNLLCSHTLCISSEHDLRFAPLFPLNPSQFPVYLHLVSIHKPTSNSFVCPCLGTAVPFLMAQQILRLLLRIASCWNGIQMYLRQTRHAADIFQYHLCCTFEAGGSLSKLSGRALTTQARCSGFNSYHLPVFSSGLPHNFNSL